MVQVSFDTKEDSLEELEHAMQLLQKAIETKRGTQHSFDMPKVEEPKEETAIDTSFLKITVHEETEEAAQPETKAAKIPSLNELINDESLNEDELNKLFKEQQKYEAEHPQKKVERQEKQDAYIEIIEYTDEKD